MRSSPSFLPVAPNSRYFAGRNKCDSHGDCSKCAMDDTLKVDTLGEIAEVEEQSPGESCTEVEGSAVGATALTLLCYHDSQGRVSSG